MLNPFSPGFLLGERTSYSRMPNPLHMVHESGSSHTLLCGVRAGHPFAAAS